jgi:site-specific DNA-cytosine methylase
VANHHVKRDKDTGATHASPSAGPPASATCKQADTYRAGATGLGYDTQWASLRASDAGAAQRANRIFVLAHQPAALPACSLPPTPAAGAFNDTESLESWQVRRERQKKPGRNGNGRGMPLAIET